MKNVGSKKVSHFIFIMHMVLSLYSSALTYICGYSNTLCSLTTAFKSIPEPVQWFSLQNGVCFKYSAAWGFEDHGHSMLVFCLVFLCNVISPDFLNFWRNVLWMMKSLNSKQFYIENVHLKLQSLTDRRGLRIPFHLSFWKNRAR